MSDAGQIYDEYEAGFMRCRELAERIVDEHEGYLDRIGHLDPITSRVPAAPPAPQGSGEHKLVADSPTFAYSLAMFLTHNRQRGNAPEMQAEIEMFLMDSRQLIPLKS